MDPPPPPPPQPQCRPDSSNPAFVSSNCDNQFSDSRYLWDYDTYCSGSDFLNFQPGLMTGNNQPFASPDFIDLAILHRGGNVRSEFHSQFESRIMNVNHVSTPADQKTFLHHHGTRRSLQFGTRSSSYMEISQAPMLTHNNRSNLQVLSYNNANIGASRSSFAQSNLQSDCSMNHMAANTMRMNFVSQESKPVHERNNGSLTDLETSSVLAVAGETCPLPNNNYSESRALVIASSAASHSIENMGPISGPIQMSPIEQQIVPYNEDMSALPYTNGVEDLNQGSPSSEREMTPGNDGINKRCGCRRSQCLKLYCDCFASGLYCLESCTCKDCRNTIDNVPEVQNARKKVESRNPLAFAPKVFNEGIESPANTTVIPQKNFHEDGTPLSSARHRTGCNCRGSKCVKKYCECFKGNAGCSYDCRCKNCENSFGRRTVIMYNPAQNGDKARSNANSVLTREIHSNNNNNHGNYNTLESNSGANSSPRLSPDHKSTRTSPSFNPHVP